MSQGTGQPPNGYGTPPGPGGYGGYDGDQLPPKGIGGTPPGSWSPSEAVDFGRKVLIADFRGAGLPLALIFCLMAVVAGMLGLAAGFFVELVRVALVRMLGEFGVATVAVATLARLTTSALQNGIQVVISALFMGGAVDFCLQLVRGRKPDFAVILGGTRYFAPMLMGELLLAVGIGLGVLLCLVPGIVLGLGCMFWSYLIVDRRLGPLEAIKQSWSLTRGHKGALLLYVMLGCVVVVVGMAACCIGAILVSAPLLAIATAWIYLRLNGEEPRFGNPDISC